MVNFDDPSDTSTEAAGFAGTGGDGGWRRRPGEGLPTFKG